MDVILLAEEAFIKQSCVEKLLLKHPWAVILKKKKREVHLMLGFKMQNKHAEEEQVDKSLRAGCRETRRAVLHRRSETLMFRPH